MNSIYILAEKLLFDLDLHKGLAADRYMRMILNALLEAQGIAMRDIQDYQSV